MSDFHSNETCQHFYHTKKLVRWSERKKTQHLEFTSAVSGSVETQSSRLSMSSPISSESSIVPALSGTAELVGVLQLVGVEGNED